MSPLLSLIRTRLRRMACGTLAALFKDTLGRTVACAALKPIGGADQKTSGA